MAFAARSAHALAFNARCLRLPLRALGQCRGFRAWLVDAEKGQLKSREVEDFQDISSLPQQDPAATVTVKVKYSDVNYKDAMIFQGMHGVVRRFPIVPGIDMAGVVEESASPLFNAGDEVVLTGNKIGQHCDGGYSELCRVQAEWLVPKPAAFSLEECMIIGTAGFTAMQMVMELEICGGLSVSNAAEPVLVLGAAGGAGSMAVALLASQGYKVVAFSRRVDSVRTYLEALGAHDVIGALESNSKPLQNQQWSAVLDCAGSPALGTALAQLRYQGAAACIGVAGAATLEASLYPFVLRGVRLLGIDATLPWNVPGYGDDPDTWRRHRQFRLDVWKRLEQLATAQALCKMHEATIQLEDLPQWAEKILAGKVRGRVVVKVG